MAELKPITIGLVGPLPPPSGGMANQTKQLVGLLTDAGHRVEVVQVNAPYRPAWAERLRGVRALFRLVPYLLRLWQVAGRADLIHVMANSGWAWHLFAAPPIWIGRLRGTPVVVNYRGGEAEPFLAKQAAWVLPTLERAAVLVVPSGFLEAVFAKHGVKAELVQNIVNLSRFRPQERAAPEPHLIVTRNLEAIYDIATAIRAFAIVKIRFPKARLTVAGSGPLRSELEQLCAQLNVADCVTFTGRVENERIPALYQSADLLLNPSQVDNMPISLLESLASGVPIVSTNVGGIPFMVKHGETAMLVPPRDPEAMARDALALLCDTELARRLRANGLQAVQGYTWDRVRPALFAVYARVLMRVAPQTAT